MNYIIMDMEWNQAVSNERMIKKPVMLYGEIIQIGAVKVDESFNYIDKIKINVRPKYYKVMNPHVREITGIQSVNLMAGEIFPQAFKRFKMWCGEDFRFITWGFDDLGILADNLTLYGLDPSYGSDYINLQIIYNRQLKSEHVQVGLSTAAESLEIPINVKVHDALGDAVLTYEVCRKLDMTLGLAEYAECVSAVKLPVSKDSISGLSDPKELLNKKEVTNVRCPHCGERLTLRQWLFGSGKGCRNIGRCPSCEENNTFLIKIKTVKMSEHSFTAMRTIYTADNEDIASYEKKLAKRAERLAAIAERGKAGCYENSENSGAKVHSITNMDDTNGK